MDNRENWLPHLIAKSVFQGSSNLRSYLISLEGWRRGLTLTVKDKKMHLYLLSSGQRTHSIDMSRIDQIPAEAIEICKNKGLAKEYLARAGVPVPKGRVFNKTNTSDEIIDFVHAFGYPVVLKPVNSSLARGVVTGIQDEASLRKGLYYIRQELGYNNIMIEKQIFGAEVRIIVLGDKAIGAYKRVPASIIGNEKDTVQKLIDRKNEYRKTNPYLRNYPLKIDSEVLDNIRKAGYDLQSVLKEGEHIVLREINSLRVGGDGVDVTEELPERVVINAIKAAKAIPGLPFAGLDMIVNLKDGADDIGTVLEVNSRPHFGAAVFPLYAKARDVPGAFIDYFFPESIENRENNRNIYFNLKGAMHPLKDY